MSEGTAYFPRMVEAPPTAHCAHCLKPPAFCVCDGIEPIDNQVALLILQHPQEQDVDLGTARLTARHFRKATVRVGLSWASLEKALGQPADPRRWAVLYLGSANAAKLAPGRDVVALNRKGAPLPDQDNALGNLDGVIVLDGNWSQAKALWWRNPWMLKCRRIALNPQQPSRYGKLRRESRMDGLSTLEAVAMLVSRLEGRAEIATALHGSFEKLLTAYRAIPR